MLTGSKTEFGDFSKIKLGNQIARGGAGTIFEIQNHPDFVLKYYHEHSNVSEYKAKIEAMINNRPDISQGSTTDGFLYELTWPVSPVSEKGKFIGYIMPALDLKDTVTLTKFLSVKSRNVNNLSGFMGYRLNIAHNIALIIKKLHEIGCLVVDLKPQNCLVNVNSMFVSIIDTDGFFVRDNNGDAFSATQFTPEYIAPELAKKRPHDANIEQDNFALSVIIFQLLNQGIHPFQAGMKRSQRTIQEMVEKNHYAYGLEGPKNLIPSKFSLHEFLPKDIREFFDQSFQQRSRPTAAEWCDALKKYTKITEGISEKCLVDLNHLKLRGVCPECELKKKLQITETNIKSPWQTKDKTPQTSRNNKVRKKSSKGAASRYNSKKTTTKIFKTNLIKQSLIFAFSTHFIASIGLYLYFNGIQSFPTNYIEIKSDKLISTCIYLIVIFIIYYRANRGAPERDCPSCGAYSGALNYIDEQKTFIKWEYQTKSGKPDMRRKSNHELYSLMSQWVCSYCEAEIEFSHVLSPTPNKNTKIDNKTIISAGKLINTTKTVKKPINPKLKLFLKRLKFFLITLLLGPYGVHRFMVGRWPTGILMLFTFGGLGLIWLFDLAWIALGRFKDKNGNII